MQFQNTLGFMSQMKDTSSVLDKVALLEATDDVTRQVLFGPTIPTNSSTSVWITSRSARI